MMFVQPALNLHLLTLSTTSTSFEREYDLANKYPSSCLVFTRGIVTVSYDQEIRDANNEQGVMEGRCKERKRESEMEKIYFYKDFNETVLQIAQSHYRTFPSVHKRFRIRANETLILVCTAGNVSFVT
uniref:Uncharacterized protein n=1 Tax=Timema bartmani TaxID=61472 RepID=A0A7R9F513_9NEOP|nr:unnamed protein product [Timema bartmani]